MKIYCIIIFMISIAFAWARGGGGGGGRGGGGGNRGGSSHYGGKHQFKLSLYKLKLKEIYENKNNLGSGGFGGRPSGGSSVIGRPGRPSYSRPGGGDDENFIQFIILIKRLIKKHSRRISQTIILWE
jgi:hypothetical protein